MQGEKTLQKLNQVVKFIIEKMQSIKYFFKRKYQQVERIIDFLPIIWKGYDFDYYYSIELFKKQLERQAKLFESDDLNPDRSKQNASRIRTAIRLMDKVYDGDYEMEQKQNKAHKLLWDFIEHNIQYWWD